jgi:hypothetical protein
MLGYLTGSRQHQDGKSGEAKQKYDVPTGPNRKTRRRRSHEFVFF